LPDTTLRSVDLSKIDEPLTNPLNKIGPLARGGIVLEALFLLFGCKLWEALGDKWIDIARAAFASEVNKCLQERKFDLDLSWEGQGRLLRAAVTILRRA
jgi:hypothetical protein